LIHDAARLRRMMRIEDVVAFGVLDQGADIRQL
jgi:hypothetical protein